MAQHSRITPRRPAAARAASRPPGFAGRVSMLAPNVNEIHGYRPDLGLRVFTTEALKKHAKGK